MPSSVVIKVKYGETLRRFNAFVKGVEGDQCLELNMEELRLKIRSLFNFPPDTDFTLTYTDEDDDCVTLADDEDLHDVLRQGLNPVRVTVLLNSNNDTSFCNESSGNSTPSRAYMQALPQNINPNVAEVFKSVPEPLRAALSMLSLDLASKAASTSPVLADLVDNLSKIGQSYLNVSSPHPGATTSSHEEVPGHPKSTSEAPIAEGLKSNEMGSPMTASKSTQALNMVGKVKELETMKPPLLPSSFTSQIGKDASQQYHAGKSGVNKDDSLLLVHLHDECKRGKEIIGDPGIKPGARMLELSKAHQENFDFYPKGDTDASNWENLRSKFDRASSTSTFDSAPLLERPLKELPLPFRHEGFYVPPPAQAFSGSFNNADGMGSIFHKGVRCDGCGVLPITGPRFKSKVNHNFDLCNICFTRMGNDADYTRIDFPLSYKHPWSLKGSHIPIVPCLNPIRRPSVLKPCVTKRIRSRLDSRFIMDVTVMDGTLMAPSTPFIKIWRLRNNGTLPWSRGLQLVWIGGDRFSASDSVEIEIPVCGVPVGNELDIAVDFIAPELPGRYMSYWRMAEPSGHRFGQRVWVLIQVDAYLKEPTFESSPSLNLNLPPESNENMACPGVNVQSSLSDFGPDVFLASDREYKTEIGDLNLPINNDLLVGGDVSCAASATGSSSVVPSSVHANNSVSLASPTSCVDNNTQPASAPLSLSYPTIDIETMLKESSASSSNVEVGKMNPEQNKGETEVEETLLNELEKMGFNQVGLNKEVLRMNDYDLERSLDDLCGVSGWDPILEELQEMGFHDKDTNKKLLVKNNGSITRVVMDLIAGEKA